MSITEHHHGNDHSTNNEKDEIKVTRSDGITQDLLSVIRAKSIEEDEDKFDNDPSARGAPVRKMVKPDTKR